MPRLNLLKALSMTNPYSSPAPSAPLRAPRSSISVLKAIAVTAGCGLGGGLFGAGLGYALGRFAPGYYRLVIRNGDRPGFNPEAVGLGLGATQGVVVGLVVGLGHRLHAGLVQQPQGSFVEAISKPRRTQL